ncbi:MAG: thioredoxin domain-containing protein [Alphaproteobacteria bacterium]|nr:MAG: thioredoxin domain-containing protein [Alphaproteobacteria bacterium]
MATHDVRLVNRLGSSRSPYLRAHADQPIAWQPWDGASRELARRRDRPILLSAGYAACHWCHVMARESFCDPTIAALVNAHFVPIKLDREEFPQVDAFYQLALAFLGVAGGWPLTMFLLPDGRPFAGGTYFPPDPRGGLPGFAQVLARLSDVWRNERERAEEAAAALMAAIESRRPAVNSRSGSGREGAADGRLEEAARRLLQDVDRQEGGLGRAPKFPQIPAVRLLWRARRLSGIGEAAGDAAETAIRAMVIGGIHDHLGGGFARYAVDRAWRVPHFEKMLYDNAEILALLAEMAQSRPALWIARVAADLVGWAMREMRVDGIGFAAALDADSEGREGAFYLWSRDELEAVLGRDFAFFARFHELPPDGHLEGRIVLNRRPLAPWRTDAEDEARLAELHERLHRRREARVRPARDDKVIAAWNGLMFAALADAGRVFHRREWIDFAQSAFDALMNVLDDGRGGIVRHVFHGQQGPAAGLEDHAALARAALALHLATGERHFVDIAAGLAQEAHRRFHDRESGLYRLGEEEGLPFAPLAESDGPTPAGTALLLEVFDALALLEEAGPWTAYAESLAQALGRIAAVRHPAAVAGAIAALDRHRRPLHLTIIGPEPADDPTMSEWLEAASSHLPPGAVLVRRQGAPPARAILCIGTICGPPMVKADELIQALKEETAR